MTSGCQPLAFIVKNAEARNALSIIITRHYD